MNDLISRQAAIDEVNDWIKAFKENCHKQSAADAYFIKDAIKQLPSAEPKRGRWISADAIFGGAPFYCSECGENTLDTVMGKPRWNFCPMCGSYNGGENEI